MTGDDHGLRCDPWPATTRLPANWDEEYHEASKLVGPKFGAAAPGVEPEPVPLPQLMRVLGAIETPLHVAVVAHRVSGLASGGYDYDLTTRALRPRAGLDVARFHAGVHLDATPTPAASIALVATFAAFRRRHGLRGYRHALVAIGRVVEAAVAAGRAEGLLVQPWIDYLDDEADRRLGHDGVEHSCLCLLGVGAGE